MANPSLPGVPAGAVVPVVSTEGPQPGPMVPPAVLAAQAERAVAEAPQARRQRYRVHLKGTGYSGRAVQYVLLNITEVDHIEEQAVRSLHADSQAALTKDQQVKSSNVANTMGLYKMVVAVSPPVAAKDIGSAKFAEVSPEKLDPEVGGQWDKLFTTKDTAILRSLYVREHQVMQKDVDEILSGKVAVAD